MGSKPYRRQSLCDKERKSSRICKIPRRSWVECCFNPESTCLLYHTLDLEALSAERCSSTSGLGYPIGLSGSIYRAGLWRGLYQVSSAETLQPQRRDQYSVMASENPELYMAVLWQHSRPVSNPPTEQKQQQFFRPRATLAPCSMGPHTTVYTLCIVHIPIK